MAVKVIFLLLMMFLANLAWISDRWLGLLGQVNFLWQRFAQMLLTYGFMIILAYFVEKFVIGQTWPQGWEFYSITFAMFLVLAFPGFVYRVLWK